MYGQTHVSLPSLLLCYQLTLPEQPKKSNLEVTPFPTTISRTLQVLLTQYHVTLIGQIDEVKIWNVAKTTTQLDNGATNVLNGNEAGLVAYYRMNSQVSFLSDTSINAKYSLCIPY